MRKPSTWVLAMRAGEHGADSPPCDPRARSLDRSTSFMRTARRLDDLAVILYDRRGYSRSRALRPIATDIDTHVDDLFDVIAGREVAVVGHSLGGLVALMAAERDPDLVRAVGAYEAPLPWYDWWPNRSRAFVSEDPGRIRPRFLRSRGGSRFLGAPYREGKDCPQSRRSRSCLRTCSDPRMDLSSTSR